jgi:hypothetical protein
VRAGGSRPAQLRHPIALRSRQMPPPLAVLARVRAQQGTFLSLWVCLTGDLLLLFEDSVARTGMEIYGFEVGFADLI